MASQRKEKLSSKLAKMKENKYEVEISQTEDKMFIAAANKVKHSEHYLIELDKDKGEEILKEFNNNFQVILDNLKVISRRLVLLNPNINDPKRANTTRNRTRKKNFRKLNKRGTPLCVIL